MSIDTTSKLVDGGPNDVPLVPNFLAAIAVVCPKCRASGGQHCQSTGGGNRSDVVTHKARIARIAGLPNRVQDAAADQVRKVGRSWYGRSAGFAAFEALAVPISVKSAKPLTPKGVRLSEQQAEEIERYVLRGGYGWIPTAHFSGDAQHRQTANALESKGIFEFVEMTSDGDDRRMKLTEFGWEVYWQHRLIIRRLTEAEVAERVARAEDGRCVTCGSQPGGGADCYVCELARVDIGAAA
jgi:hypothetical protein